MRLRLMLKHSVTSWGLLACYVRSNFTSIFKPRLSYTDNYEIEAFYKKIKPYSFVKVVTSLTQHCDAKPSTVKLPPAQKSLFVLWNDKTKRD